MKTLENCFCRLLLFCSLLVASNGQFDGMPSIEGLDLGSMDLVGMFTDFGKTFFIVQFWSYTINKKGYCLSYYWFSDGCSLEEDAEVSISMLCDLGCLAGGYTDGEYTTDDSTWSECICSGPGTNVEAMIQGCDQVCEIICKKCNEKTSAKNPCPKALKGEENNSRRCECNGKPLLIFIYKPKKIYRNKFIAFLLLFRYKTK